MSEDTASPNPFPGLRPFEAAEAHLYFGRDEQRDELLKRLGRSRFLAVVGPSGSGKSSLVRAGLLPDLYGGFMVQAGSRWRVGRIRPAGDPIGNLARELNARGVFGGAGLEPGQRRREAGLFTEITLRRGPLGLVEATRQGGLRTGENLLLLVDQFEEIFRFQQAAPVIEDDSAAFVKLLLEATRQSDIPLYVILTMRSDYMGDCARFRDLPEAINDGLYLIPRMTRDQMRQAIEKPAKVGGGEVSPPLVQRLLSEVGDDPDQLPVLQHALRRSWDRWRQSRSDSSPLGLDRYQEIGGLAEALSKHADEAYDELPDSKSRKIAETLFKRLTERGEDQREIRRPTRFDELCKVAQAEAEEVAQVIKLFRRRDRSFLMPPPEVDLSGDPVIDISHESLMRLWRKLKGWVEDEAESAQRYRRLADRADEAEQAGLMGEPELSIYLKWRRDHRPTKDWGERYARGKFDRAMAFLDESRAARDAAVLEKEEKRKAELRRTRRFAIAFGLLFLLSLAAALLAAWQWQQADWQSELAFARQLAARAELERPQEPARLQLSTLLALESIMRFPEDAPYQEAEQILRQNLAFLPRPVAPLLRQGRVTAVAYSLDGAYLAAAEGSRALVWEWHPEEGIRGDPEVLPHDGRVLAIAFSPADSRRLTTASGNQAWLWDLKAGGTLNPRRFQHDGEQVRVSALAFSPDGATFAAGGNERTLVWDLGTGRTIQQFQSNGRVVGLAFHPKDAELAVAEGRQARLLDLQTGRSIMQVQHDDRVTAVAFSPDGDFLATGSADRTARIWELSGREVARMQHGTRRGRSPIEDPVTIESPGVVQDVSFSPDGTFLATASSDRTARVWQVDGGREVFRMVHERVVNSVSFSPDGKHLATASVYPPQDSDGRFAAGWVWELSRGDEVGRMSHQYSVTALAFSPDGKHLATATRGDERVRVWEALARDKEIAGLVGQGGVHSVAFSLDSKSLFAVGGDGISRAEWEGAGGVWDISRPTQSRNQRVVLSLHGDFWAAAGEDSAVRVWRTADGEEIARLEAEIQVSALAVSPDGNYLAAAGRDDRREIASEGESTVWVWQTASKQEVTQMDYGAEVTDLAFSPDGDYLAAASEDFTVRVWRTASGQEAAPRMDHPEPVRAVSFSADAKLLATVSGEASARDFHGRVLATRGGNAWVWEVSSGRTLARIAHKDGVIRAAFSPDGSLLAAAGSDGVARVWRWRIEDLIEQTCARLTRNLSLEEWNRLLPDQRYRQTCSNLPGASQTN